MRNWKNNVGIIFVLISLWSSLSAQIDPKKTNFGSPLTIPLVLAGNFCELRPNHFHTGLDIKTQGRQGIGVKSIEDGFVSRIAYSHYGYGLVLYIDHPNGYTSVYAHLKSVNKTIAKKIKEIQYKEKSETFNALLDSNELVVKKGEIIGLSGSSGSSYAPHLHFEIRQTETEYAVNPLLFGFDIKDTRKPDVKGIKVYPLDDSSTVNGSHEATYIYVKNDQLTKQVSAHGKIGLGIHTTDRLNAAGNICGVYSVELMANKNKIYQHKMEFMDFEKNRYINHHKDYEEYTFNKRNIHKNFIKGNNTLAIYDSLTNNGILQISKGDEVAISYIIKDAYSNTSRLAFKILGEEKKVKTNRTSCDYVLLWDKPNAFDTTDFGFIMAPLTIYDNECLVYSKSKEAGFLSELHTINSYRVPVQKYFTIKIKPSVVLADDLKNKLLVVYKDEKGRLQARGGEYLNGYVHSKVRDYGDYGLMIDTIAPYCQWLTDTNSLKNLKSNATIHWKIGDNLSGLDSYNIYIEGRWLLTTYDRKRNTLSLDLSEANLKAGNYRLSLSLSDERQNKHEETVTITINN